MDIEITKNRSSRIYHNNTQKDVVKVFDRKIGPSVEGEDLVFLFKVWNTYIEPDDEPQDISCAACRIFVQGNLKQYVNYWKEFGHNGE